jgi:hypothetical protein
MASSSKKRTTMAKLARENKLRERRAEKQARREARKYGAPETAPDGEGDPGAQPDGDLVTPEPAPEAVPGQTEA